MSRKENKRKKEKIFRKLRIKFDSGSEGGKVTLIKATENQTKK